MGKKGRGGRSGDARRGGSGSRSGGSGRMRPALEQQVIEALGMACSASAVDRFDKKTDTVRRVVVKVNPQVYGQFLALAIMQSDVRYEGVINQATRWVDWCDTPNCTCTGFLAIRSSLETGFSIDD